MKSNLLHIKQIILVSLLSLLIFLSWTSLVFSQWVVVTSPQVSPDWNLWSVSFVGPSNGWAVGEDTSNKRGVLLAYPGSSWTGPYPVSVSSASWSLIGVDLAPSGGGWAVGYDQAGKSGVLLHYSNGQWGAVAPPPVVSSNWELADVQMISSTEGWAVGADLANGKGVLIHLLNGTPSVVNPPAYSGSNWYFSGVFFTSSTEGWVIGSDSSGSSSKAVLLHYLNGTWTFVPPPAANSSWLLNDLFLTSPSEGWAVGYRTEAGAEAGVLLHCSNGSWKAVTPPNISSNWYLMGIHFTSSSEGWAVGYDQVNKRGVLLHYLNGQWASVAPPQVSLDWELRSVHFTSPGQGWAVGWDHTNKMGVILSYAAPETITKPDPPSGPTTGDTNTSYIYSTGGSVSNIGDSIQYRFDWRDQSKSAWLPVGVISAPKSWAVPGTYVVKAQALCAKHQVVSDWSEGVSVNISGVYFPIVLASPKEGTAFDPCSLYGPPTFEWTAEEPFKSYEIQFSPSSDFGKISKKIKATSTSLLISSTLWKGVLLLPEKSGGTVYWRVVGTRADKTIATSQPFSMLASPPEPVQSPNLSTTSRSALPELTWENACNVKFKVWFGNDPDFKKRTILNFNLKNPLDNGGVFQSTLTSRQWETIRKLVGDQTGETLYWYIECWDGLGRYSKTDAMNFKLTD